MPSDAVIAPREATASVERANGPRLFVPSLAPFYASAEPVAYATLRVMAGIAILSHGVPKLFRLPHGQAADAYAGVVKAIGQRIGLPAPDLWAVLVTAVESAGAVMLIVGLATRVVAPLLLIEMIVIAFGIHYPRWLWSEGGMEYPFVLIGVFAAIALRGGGRYSIDRLLGREV